MLKLINLMTLVLAALVGAAGPSRAQTPPPDEARAIAAEARGYAYAPVQA